MPQKESPLPALVAAAISLLALVLASPAVADVLVLRDGSQIETRGPWTVKGRMVVFTSQARVLSSMPVDEVDLEASRAISRRNVAPPPQTKTSAPPLPPAKPLLVVTNEDVGGARGGGGLVGVLESLYEQYRQASVAGNLDAHRAVRDDEMLGKMKGLTADDLRLGADSLERLGDQTFLGLDQRDRWARLRYYVGASEPDAAGPRVRFCIVIFRRWGPTWKVVRFGGIDLPARDAGDPPSLAGAELPPQLRIDDDQP